VAYVFRHDHDVDLVLLARLFESAGWARRGGDVLSLAKKIAGSRWVVTAWEAGTLVGFARAISDGVTTAYVTDVVVAPAHRMRGVARELMSQMMAGRDDIQFLLRAEPGLHAFYRSIGFGDPDEVLRRARKGQ
jgi:ribosomal protein S18 acetylase RimI-like enzyme